ncbi:aldehyde dehydrogenase family protein, partial [Streptomyces xiaopingdaonensis]|uniref:aldehyde dehydrogenase family protein n=1 Tax=Streptomyces xiaopingdaonensis TaxID=1565415 RepID=UPI000523FDCD
MSRYAVTDPASGTVVREYPTATGTQIESALADAVTAGREWARSTGAAERAALVGRVAELHDERRDELAAAIVREMGKPLREAVEEVEFSSAIYAYYAEH